MGVQQAHKCGQYLREYMKSNDYTCVILESSPFLRCMETAAAIAKEIGIDEINVNYRYSEWLKKKFFPYGSPIPGLIINNSLEADFIKEWLQGIKISHNFDYAKELSARYPEYYEDAGERIVKHVNHSVKAISKSDKKVAHFVITHGICVKHFAELASSRSTFRNRVPIIDSLDYTAIAAAVIRGK